MTFISQKGANGPVALTANGEFQSSTDGALETLVGTRWDLNDGREVILVHAGSATTIAPGRLYQDAAIIADHQNLDVTAFTAYSNNGNVPATVTATLGATSVTANQYRGGYVVVNDVTGEGQTLRIESHPAANAASSLTITLEDAPNTDLDATSEICLIPAHGNGVIIFPTTATNVAAGVGLYPIAASAYGFLVSKGITSCLGDGALTAGSAISPSNAVAGAVENGVIAQGLVGTAVQTGVDTEFRTVFINV